MQSSLPERESHPLLDSPNANQKTIPTATYSSGTLLLRVCGLLFGATFVIVFGTTLLIALLKEPNPPLTEPTEQMTARHEKETSPPQSDDTLTRAMSPTDPKNTQTNVRIRAELRDRVPGGNFQASHRDAAPSLDELAPTEPPQPSPNLLAPSKTKDAAVAFEERSKASEEDLRQQLLAMPELRLFSDFVVENFREKEKYDERSVKGVPREQIDYAYNAQMNKYMHQAGLEEGLPFVSVSKCQLAPDFARMVQTVSKDLRDMGFVSVPGVPVRVSFQSSGRVANVGPTTIQHGSPKEKIEAFQEWCDVNTVEKYPGALATLLQMLQVEDVPMRLLLVRELAKAQGASFTAALATAALVDLSAEVRQAAVAALEKRPSDQYVSVLLQGFRYPWSPVADYAALALRKLKPQGIAPKLVALLNQPDPALPVLDAKTKKPVVRELVRLNHLRNCLLCHAPSANVKDGLVRGLVPTPGQPLPRLYYDGQKGDFVRADITFLRPEFSVNLPVAAPGSWPSEQRFDFVTRTRPAKPEEIRGIASKEARYPQRDAVLYALRGLTGKDGGESYTTWCELLGLAKSK